MSCGYAFTYKHIALIRDLLLRASLMPPLFKKKEKKKKKEKGEVNPPRHTARKRRLLDNTAFPDFVR